MAFPLNPVRDPRHDPQPGDMIELGNGAIARVKWRWWRILEIEVSHNIGMNVIWLGHWRRWAKWAKVLHREPDPTEQPEGQDDAGSGAATKP